MAEILQNSYIYVEETGEQIITYSKEQYEDDEGRPLDILVPMLDDEGRLIRINAKTKIVNHQGENSAADYLLAYKKKSSVLIDAVIDLEHIFTKSANRSNCALVLPDYDGSELSITAAELKAARDEISSIFVNNVSTLTKIGGKSSRNAPILLSGSLYAFLTYLYTTDRAALGLYNFDSSWKYSFDAVCPKDNQFVTAYLESTLASRVFDRNVIMSLLTRYNKVVNAEAIKANGNKNIVINETLAAFFGSYAVYGDMFESEDDFNAMTEGYLVKAPFILADEGGKNVRVPNADLADFSAFDYFYTMAVDSYNKSPTTVTGREKPVPDQMIIHMNELMFLNSALVISAPDLKKHSRALIDAGFFEGFATDKTGKFTVTGAVKHLSDADTIQIVSEFRNVVTKPSSAKETTVRSAAAKEKAAKKKPAPAKKFAIA